MCSEIYCKFFLNMYSKQYFWKDLFKTLVLNFVHETNSDWDCPVQIAGSSNFSIKSTFRIALIFL